MGASPPAGRVCQWAPAHPGRVLGLDSLFVLYTLWEKKANGIGVKTKRGWLSTLSLLGNCCAGGQPRMWSATLSMTPFITSVITRPAFAAVFLIALRWPFIDLAFIT